MNVMSELRIVSSDQVGHHAVAPAIKAKVSGLIDSTLLIAKRAIALGDFRGLVEIIDTR